MPEREYKDLDITLRRRDTGGYRVEAEASGGHTEAEFAVPFDDAERDAFRQLLVGAAREFGQPKGPADNPLDTWEQVMQRGERLYDALFTGDVRASLVSACDWARSQQEPHGVRIRLHLDDAPELSDLPWEYLYDSKRQEFLALHDQTPIVRHPKQPDPIRFPRVVPPIRMLVMIARGDPPLDVEGEWEQIRSKLAPLQDEQLLALTRVPAATTASLQECMNTATPFHIFHFIGHGGLVPDPRDPTVQRPVLGLDDGQLAADQLTTYLDPSTLRLVVLNSCDGARPASGDAGSAFAGGLIRRGVPAVIAMQRKITDEAAIRFAAGIYGALAKDRSIESAMTIGRVAIWDGGNRPTEWATPALFMRGPDGRLFALDVSSQQAARRREIDELAKQARDWIDEKQYDRAIQLLQKIQDRYAAMNAAR